MINQPHRPAAEIINGVAANLVGGFNPLENYYYYYSQLVHTLAASLDGTLQPNTLTPSVHRRRVKSQTWWNVLSRWNKNQNNIRKRSPSRRTHHLAIASISNFRISTWNVQLKNTSKRCIMSSMRETAGAPRSKKKKRPETFENQAQWAPKNECSGVPMICGSHETSHTIHGPCMVYCGIYYTHMNGLLLSGWWFQPIWKIFVKMGIFQIGVNIKNLWNHQLLMV